MKKEQKTDKRRRYLFWFLLLIIIKPTHLWIEVDKRRILLQQFQEFYPKQSGLRFKRVKRDLRERERDNTKITKAGESKARRG